MATITMISGIRFSVQKARTSSSVLFWFYDGFSLVDKNGQKYWAPANDKKSLAMQGSSDLLASGIQAKGL